LNMRKKIRKINCVKYSQEDVLIDYFYPKKAWKDAVF